MFDAITRLAIELRDSDVKRLFERRESDASTRLSTGRQRFSVDARDGGGPAAPAPNGSMSERTD